MRLAIDTVWRERLRQVRSGQAICYEIEALLGCEAIFLYGWLGNSSYLGLDGRLVGWGEADRSPPAVVDNPAEVAKGIVLGAHQLGMRDLVDLLPPISQGTDACPWCEGRRWDDTPYAGYPDGGVCLLCKGVGWRIL